MTYNVLMRVLDLVQSLNPAENIFVYFCLQTKRKQMVIWMQLGASVKMSTNLQKIRVRQHRMICPAAMQRACWMHTGRQLRKKEPLIL